MVSWWLCHVSPASRRVIDQWFLTWALSPRIALDATIRYKLMVCVGLSFCWFVVGGLRRGVTRFTPVVNDGILSLLEDSQMLMTKIPSRANPRSASRATILSDGAVGSARWPSDVAGDSFDTVTVY